MEVRVRLFAMLREQAGTSDVVLDLPDGSQVRDAIAQLEHLAAAFPSSWP